MLEQELPTRMELLNAFAWMKRGIRSLKLMREDSARGLRSMLRAKHKLEALVSRFDARKIEVLREAIEIHRRARKEINLKISTQGAWLAMFCHDADQILSDHDKAQILGISHIRLERIRSALYGGGIPLGLFALIHACQAEHRHEYLDVPEQAPLWEVAHLFMLCTMVENDDFRETMSEAAGEWLQEMGVLIYRRTVGPDGKEQLERMPPTLKVVH